jgi:hypothetical protein
VSGRTRRLHDFELEPEARDWLDSLSDIDFKRVDEVCGILAEEGTELAARAVPPVPDLADLVAEPAAVDVLDEALLLFDQALSGPVLVARLAELNDDLDGVGVLVGEGRREHRHCRLSRAGSLNGLRRVDIQLRGAEP